MGRRKKQPAPYNIPENVLNVLNEHCNHGWLLFTYDDQDQFRLYCNFDNPLIMKSIRNDVTNWISAMKQLETNMSISSLMNISPPNPEENDEDN